MKMAARYSAILAVMLAGCGERQTTAQGGAPAARTHQDQTAPNRPKLLVVDRSKPTSPAWMVVDGKRVDVLPATAFTTANIAAPVRATIDGVLTGEVTIVPDSPFWSTAGNQNTTAPVVSVIGYAGSPMSWRRVPITITHVILRNPDGSQRTVAAKGWLVDADDEVSGVRCVREQPDFSTGQRAEPTVQIPAGKRVVIIMSETVVL